MSDKLKFNKSSSLFLSTLRGRIDQYFTESGKSRYANPLMWIKTALFLGLLVASYFLLLFHAFPVWGMILTTIVLGASAAFVGFNVCHDAIHGAYSSNKNVNRWLGSIFHLLGANPYVWNLSHNVVHHTYTNIAGHDDDLDVAPGLIRLSQEEPINSFHRYQHWYAFPLYGLASLSWVFRKDFKKFFQARIGQTITRHPKIEYFNLFFFKAAYLFLFLALPMMVIDLPWWQILIGFLILHAAQGTVMGLVFQLAHVVEETRFPIPNDAGNMDDAWAEHQMRTTANFAGNNWFAAFFLGGLNRQIEHHLFPKICHIHYAEIGVIVKDTAYEFGIPYNESPSFLDALQSHLRLLKKMGTAES